MSDIDGLGNQNPLVLLTVAFLAFGGLSFVNGVVKDWRSQRNEAPRPVDANILTVTKARDAVARDLEAERGENARLRQALADEEARNAARENALRAEIEHLEAKLRALLDELSALKSRHGFDPAS